MLLMMIGGLIMLGSLAYLRGEKLTSYVFAARLEAFIRENPFSSTREVFEGVVSDVSYRAFSRRLSVLERDGVLVSRLSCGCGRRRLWCLAGVVGRG